jgi:hypothetical protein
MLLRQPAHRQTAVVFGLRHAANASKSGEGTSALSKIQVLLLSMFVRNQPADRVLHPKENELKMMNRLVRKISVIIF